MSGAWQAGAFFVISVSAYYLLQRRHLAFAQRSLKIGLSVALVASLLQFISGDISARHVAKNQPAKLAAFEGHYHTEAAPLYLFGWVNENQQRVQFGIAIPKMLSYLTYGDVNKPVTGLEDFEPEDRPPINFVFQTYHAMVAIGCGLIALSLLGVFLWWRGLLFADVPWVRRFVLPVMVLSVLGPQLANQLGWFSAEVGRQPWIVYGLLRTSDALSKVVAADVVLTSLILFTLVYSLLFALFIFLLNEKIQHGPGTRKSSRRTPSLHASRNPRPTPRMNDFFAQTLTGRTIPALNDIWFVLVGVLFTGYVMLDGFDLGVGALHLFTKTDEERRLMLNSIGPVWDGNEVWLVTGGGALFAAFPEVYATVFSGFYLAFVLLLFALIFRAVAIEFRSKRPGSLVAANLGRRSSASAASWPASSSASPLATSSGAFPSTRTTNSPAPFSACSGLTPFCWHHHRRAVRHAWRDLRRHENRRRNAGPRPRLDSQHHHLLHPHLRHDHHGDSALHSPHGAPVAECAMALHHPAPQHRWPSPTSRARFISGTNSRPSFPPAPP